ncbi:pirin family protein [Polynucleobacter sp.]|uniref:pirin family protein n=1 Tax=Polynucleobacter sp. TaxID=2029855 RepID=UPI0035264263
MGDGFPVRTLFSYQSMGEELSPFLMLDYASPAAFPPSAQAKGVGPHPHRGFETVTIVYKGELAHKDSAGNSGTIGPGDVQWMTAGAGILHEEMHSAQFTQQGGMLSMAQLWVNLPANQKMRPPGYQAIEAERIPCIQFENDQGTARLIAGKHTGLSGPAKTHTAMQVWDLQIKKGAVISLPAPNHWTAALAILQGQVKTDKGLAGDASLITYSQAGSGIELVASQDTHALFLSGEPIREPMVGYGPFVMNTKAEIAQAIDDFNSGQFGRLD